SSSSSSSLLPFDSWEDFVSERLPVDVHDWIRQAIDPGQNHRLNVSAHLKQPHAIHLSQFAKAVCLYMRKTFPDKPLPPPEPQPNLDKHFFVNANPTAITLLCEFGLNDEIINELSAVGKKITQLFPKHKLFYVGESPQKPPPE